MNAAGLSFMQNNLFKRVLTATIPQSQIHQILLFRSWPLQSYKTTQLNHSYKLCKDCLKKFQLSLFTIMWRLCGWFVRVFMPEEGRGWGWNCPWTKCIESWLTETSAIFWWQSSYEYTVLFLLWLLLLFLYNFVVIFGIWVFHTQFTPKDWLLFLEEKTTESFGVEL